MSAPMEVGVLNFDPVAAEYDASRYLPSEAQDEAARILCEYAALPPDGLLLDAGVGTGRFALPLARRGVRVVGTDISMGMMRQLQAKRQEVERQQSSLPVSLFQSDLRRLPIRSRVFQAVLTVHILHLIADWALVLDEIARITRPGGRLLMAWENGREVPTRDHYFARARERAVLREHRGATSMAAILEHLETRGAEVERVAVEAVRWTTCWPVRATLEYLQRRTWSTLWTVPDSVHAELMAETEAWARETYGTLDTSEESGTTLSVWVARWPA